MRPVEFKQRYDERYVVSAPQLARPRSQHQRRRTAVPLAATMSMLPPLPTTS